MQTVLLLIILMQTVVNLAVFLLIVLHIYTNGLPIPRVGSRGIAEPQRGEDGVSGESYGIVDVLDIEMDELHRSGQKEVDEIMGEQVRRIEENTNPRDPYR